MTHTISTFLPGHLITDDGIKIDYDHYRNGFDRVIILAPGFFNSKSAILFKDMAKELGRDYDIIVFDFRGHGKSRGLFYWTAKEYLDLQTVLAYANQNYGKIGVVGFSLGAATSIITAARDERIDSLIAVSAPSQFNKIDFRFWEMDLEENIIYNVIGAGRIGKGLRPGPFWRRKQKPVDVVGKIKIPVLFIHGANDWLIKPWHSEMLFQKAQARQKSLEIIPNGTHAEFLFRSQRPVTLQLFREWFGKTLILEKTKKRG